MVFKQIENEVVRARYRLQTTDYWEQWIGILLCELKL